MILDTSALYSYFVRETRGHTRVFTMIEFASRDEQLLLSPFVVAELESVVLSRFGVDGWLVVLEELRGGAWSLAELSSADLRSMCDVVEDCPELSLAAASVLVLAARTGGAEVASFRSVFLDGSGLGGRQLVIVPEREP